MPTLDELLKAKSKRLETVPGKFASNIEIVQRQLLDEIVLILAEFDVSEGEFVISERNVALAGELDVKLREALNRSEYEEAITERDRALELVYKNAEIAQRAIEAAERKSG